MKNIKRFAPLLVVFLLGIIVNQGISIAIAHGGNVNFVHSCVKDKDGSIRIVGPNDLCNGKEKAVDWSQNGIGTFGGFTTNQLIGFAPVGESFDYRIFDNANFTSAYFANTSMINASFIGANFTNASFYNGNSRPNLSMDNTNFTNANFTNANISGIYFSTAILTGAIWSNTTCPDNTNSDNNGNTCEGHLVP